MVGKKVTRSGTMWKTLQKESDLEDPTSMEVVERYAVLVAHGQSYVVVRSPGNCMRPQENLDRPVVPNNERKWEILPHGSGSMTKDPAYLSTDRCTFEARRTLP